MGFSRSAWELVASPVSISGKPAAVGVSTTMKASMAHISAIAADGIRNTQYQGQPAKIQPPTVIARKEPLEIMMPKMPPNTPRSGTRNQGALILTMERAAKDWK